MNARVVSPKVFSLLCFAVLCFFSPFSIKADGLGKATITVIKNKVLISKEGGAERVAALKDVITSNTVITTGENSHVELSFADQSIVRLGSKTVFSFDHKTREMNLQRGMALIYVPQKQGGAKISTPIAAAVIHGDVVAIRYAGKGGVTEFVHLSPKDAEGPMTVTHHRTGEERVVGGGQLLRVYPSEARLSKPVDVSVAVFAHTSTLFTQKGKGGAKVRPLPKSGEKPSGSGSGAGGDTSNTSPPSDSTTPDEKNETPSDNTTTNPDTPKDPTIIDTVKDTVDTVAPGTSTTVDSTIEDFAELPPDAESEIIQEEAEQISEVQGGTLEVSSGTEIDTTDTTTSTDTSTTVTTTTPGTTDTPVSADTSTTTTTSTATAPEATDTTLSSTDSDITLLKQIETTAKSLITQTTEAPIGSSTVIAEEDDAVSNVTAEVLCTPTELLSCPPTD